MHNVPYQHLTPDEIGHFVEALEKAIAEHSRCLNNWHRSLICNLPVAESYMEKNAHRQCEFGQWYYHQSATALRDLEDFIMIDKLHRAVHDSAYVLAIKMKKGQAITARDYDTFIEKERELYEGLLKLRDELRDVLSGFDPLTGIFNRQTFYLILSQEHARSSRTAQPCCISMVDLDHFKTVNDRYGHPAGDNVLREAAQYLKSEIRPYDSICRYGGEEFLICLPNTSMKTAEIILDRLRKGFASLSIASGEGHSIRITASFGVAKMGSGVAINDTIARADKALYAAKRNGRNHVTVWEDMPKQRNALKTKISEAFGDHRRGHTRHAAAT
ncbi:diguanylate cyclase [Thermodesulfobacteriota bacterium]